MTEDLWLRVATHKYATDLAEESYAAVRREADQRMNRGDRYTVMAPDGVTKLGAVSKSAPKKTAQIHDLAALLEWARVHYPKAVLADADVTGPEDEVKEFLWNNGGRHLLTPREIISPDLRKAILEASNLAKAPCGPGGEMDVPGVRLAEAAPSRVSFLPDDDGAEMVVELMRSGAVKFPDLFARPESTVDDEPC